MKTRRQRIGGAIVLLLGAIAAVCLTGCGETGRGLTAYRDKQVEVPAAKTGVKAGAERAPKSCQYELSTPNTFRFGTVTPLSGCRATPGLVMTAAI